MKRAFKIILSAVLCFSALFGAACRGDTGTKGNYTGPLEIPEGKPIIPINIIGEKWPNDPVLPAKDDGRAPYMTGAAGSKNGVYTLSEDTVAGENGIRATYPAAGRMLSAWDYFFADVANWQSGYTFIALKFDRIEASKLTVAAFYTEMSDTGNPLVPVLVTTFIDPKANIYIDISDIKTISADYEPTNELLREKEIVRLFFFLETNPAQNSEFEEGGLSFSAYFSKTNPQQARISGEAVNSGHGVYYINGNQGAQKTDTTIQRVSSAAGSYVEFPVSEYEFEETGFTDLRVNLSYEFTRSITAAAVFSGGQADWRNYVLLDTITNPDGGTDYLSGKEQVYVFSLNAAQIKTNAGAAINGGSAVEGEFAGKYKITHIRLYIDAGAETYTVPNTANANTLSESPNRLVTIHSIDFMPGTEGVRIGRGWRLGDGNRYMVIDTSVQMGGIGKITVTDKGGWYYLALPVTDFDWEYSVLTARFSGPVNAATGEPMAANPNLHFGLALGNPETVLTGAWDYFDEENSVLPFDAGYEELCSRTLTYDKETDTYTIVMDMTGKLLHTGGYEFYEILIFLNNPNDTDKFDVPFVVELRGIEFSKPAE